VVDSKNLIGKKERKGNISPPGRRSPHTRFKKKGGGISHPRGLNKRKDGKKAKKKIPLGGKILNGAELWRMGGWARHNRSS